MERRLRKEYQKIEELYPNQLTVSKLDNKTIVEFNIYKFIIDKSYPFKSPYAFINNIEYYNLLKINSEFINNELCKLDIKCLCCTTILCSSIWYPGKSILSVVEEYKKNKSIINKIIKKQYVIKICSQNNIPLELCDNISNYI